MTETGSSTKYRDDFTQNCSACKTNASLVDGLTKRDQRLVGAFEVRELKVVWNKPNAVVATGRLSHPEFRIVEGARIVRRIPALKRTYFIWHLVPVNGRWLVDSVEAIR